MEVLVGSVPLFGGHWAWFFLAAWYVYFFALEVTGFSNIDYWIGR